MPFTGRMKPPARGYEGRLRSLSEAVLEALIAQARRFADG